MISCFGFLLSISSMTISVNSLVSNSPILASINLYPLFDNCNFITIVWSILVSMLCINSSNDTDIYIISIII